MEMKYDATIDALAIQFAPGRGRFIRTKEIQPGVHVDFDEKGHVVAFELLDASRHIPLKDLEGLPSPVHYLTLAEAAKESGLTAVTLRVQIRNKRLAALKRGRDWLIAEHDLFTYLESRKPSGRPASNPIARKRRKASRRA